MKQIETISKFFHLNDLNTIKYQEILRKAQDINKFKNMVSCKIHQNIIKYSNFSKFDFIKEFFYVPLFPFKCS